KTLPLKHREQNTGKTFLVNNMCITPFDIIDKLNVY
ncbi:ArsR family transcriptional regulator, partial [Salmonella enterica subsp. enterica serovar Schwarzengrund]